MNDTIANAVNMIPSLSSISDAVSGAISDWFGTALNNTVGLALYVFTSAVSWIISLAYQLFEVFSGQIKVSYKGGTDYLVNIFFENSAISGIYWGMAIIGVVLCFAFTIIAVFRKMIDGADKMQTTMGAILTSTLKSIILILSLNISMIAVLNFSNVLMQRLVYVFNAGASLTEEQRIDFTDDQYAAMGRVLNTIGNYSLNPSYNSRYNLNSCYNEIRGDILYLQEQGVFDFYYLTKDANGKEIETWQSALQTLVFAANLEEELKMDVYNEGVSNALLDIMVTLRTNSSFYPLEYYERSPAPNHNIPFDRLLFLACTYDAALNKQFNINPSHTDVLRGPYYNGEKSIYDFDQVAKDFNLIWGFNYVMFALFVYGILKEMIYILYDCVARIYNMVLLYLIAPPFIALSPLDGGGKVKQWMLAFVVQCFGVFGTVVAMRLLLIFAPIIISTELEIFSNPAMDIAAKVIMVQAGCLVVRKAGALFTGILADSAGWQAISASNLRTDYDEQKRKNEAKADKKEAAKEKARQKEEQARQRTEPLAQQKIDQQEKDKDAANPTAGGGSSIKNVENLASSTKGQEESTQEKVGDTGGGDPVSTPTPTPTPASTPTPDSIPTSNDTDGSENGIPYAHEKLNSVGTTDTDDNVGSIPVPPPLKSRTPKLKTPPP